MAELDFLVTGLEMVGALTSTAKEEDFPAEQDLLCVVEASELASSIVADPVDEAGRVSPHSNDPS